VHDFLCTENEAVLTTYNIGRTQTETIKRKLEKIVATEAHCTATRGICVHNLGCISLADLLVANEIRVGIAKIQIRDRAARIAGYGFLQVIQGFRVLAHLVVGKAKIICIETGGGTVIPKVGFIEFVGSLLKFTFLY
jgi:hypothetical protein